MPVELLRLSNFDLTNQTARSEVASTAVSGQKTIELINAGGFVSNSFIVLAPTEESAEIHQIDAIVGNQLTVKANLTSSFPAGTRVLQLAGNQIKVYRAANIDGTVPDDSAFEALSSSVPTNPITIQPDQTFTEMSDPSGGPDYWYKATYYDSLAPAETPLSLALAVRGGDYGHFASLEDIREQAGFSQLDYVTDMQVSLERDKAEAEINARLGSLGYALPIEIEVPLLTSITQLLGAGHLLRRSYGTGAEGTTKEGSALLKDGRAMLDQLTAGTIQLVDVAGNVLPNTVGTSGQDASGVEGSRREPRFTMGAEF